MKNLEDLIIYSKNFLKENYNLELTHEMKINSRLTSSYGHVKFDYDYSDVIEISIAKRVLDHGCLEVIIDTLKHELIHYALWKSYKPFGDNDEYFKNELKKHNASAENENGYLGEGYQYNCECGNTYIVSKKSSEYICHCKNKSKLKLTKKIYSDGINFKLLEKYTNEGDI